jgi:hypothetical protein
MQAMIDLETLDTSPRCTILTLGGIKFDPYSDKDPDDQIYMRIDLDDQDRLGRISSDSTIEWWGKQDQAAQDEAFSEHDRIPLQEAMVRLRKWVWGSSTVWGHGYGFDMTIIEDACRQVGEPIPWNFWQVKDSRTLFSLCKKDPRKVLGQTGLHNALADAYFQAKGVQMAYKELGIKK